ncbi:MAG: ABC transporter substrate-binding protein, partial [Desertimonas sp.]
PNNAAVMDLLNEECVPQMMALSGLPEFGDEVADYPWTFGGQMVYDVEAAAYAQSMVDTLGEGITAAIFYTNSEFGQVYQEAFGTAAGEAGISIVSEQTIEATDTAPPTAQINEIAAQQPDAIMAVPLGAGCPVFLAELENAKAANAGWDPAVYITNTCASQLILMAAGEAADGIYTSAYSGLHDVLDPAQAALPDVAEYVARMTDLGKTDFLSTAAAGWNTAEVTVEIIRRAAESESGLSRVSIIEAARDLDYHPSLARDGANARMAGEEDGFLFEAVQVIRYDQPNGIWVDVGEMILDDES